MTCNRRLLLLLTLLMAYSLFVVECNYRQHEDTAAADVRHRHRHRHESARRNRHDLADRRSPSSWSQEIDYEDDSTLNEDAYENEEDEDADSDYDVRYYHDSLGTYPRRSDYQYRNFEPRYLTNRYQHRGGYHGNAWYDEENERRRSFSRYVLRGTHRGRPNRNYHRVLGYPRNRNDFDASVTDDEESLDYEKSGRYDGGPEKHHRRAWWRVSKKHWINSRRDWRGRQSGGYRGKRIGYRENDLEGNERADGSRRVEHWRRNSNFSSDSKGRRKDEEDEEYEDPAGSMREKDEEEDEIWKEIEDDYNDDEEEIDNDFYKRQEKPPLKTYDDIIRRLTSDDPSTLRPTVKRDYRNIGAQKKSYGDFRYEPRNLTRPLQEQKLSDTSHVATTANYFVKKKTPVNGVDEVKPAGSSIDRKHSKNAIGVVVKVNDRQERKPGSRIDDSQARTKSLEVDYDEYLNAGDNEKEEDLIKAGVEEDMQADVTNADYTDDENTNEDETPANTLATSSTTTTTTSTTTTTTTTTPKPIVVTQRFDYRDPRAYESGTGTQYNGYQSKNDYPPMSAHSVHKWQSLGTRESVKETRGNMQQFNKNGKSAEVKEALQHAIKVSREGSCQWPRARVIPVRDVYPSPSTSYIPHCAILHRCSDDTGCCRSESLTCVPKQSHRVELSFYTTNVGGTSVVEKLSFYNHTECECRDRAEYDSTIERSSEQRFYRNYPSSQQPQNMKRAPPRKACRCPSEFNPRITQEGECQCNCQKHSQNCIKTRRGKGYFSLADRLCIQNGECAVPICEFGEYMRRQGKCPRARKWGRIEDHATLSTCQEIVDERNTRREGDSSANVRRAEN